MLGLTWTRTAAAYEVALGVARRAALARDDRTALEDLNLSPYPLPFPLSATIVRCDVISLSSSLVSLILLVLRFAVAICALRYGALLEGVLTWQMRRDAFSPRTQSLLDSNASLGSNQPPFYCPSLTNKQTGDSVVASRALMASRDSNSYVWRYTAQQHISLGVVGNTIITDVISECNQRIESQPMCRHDYRCTANAQALRFRYDYYYY